MTKERERLVTDNMQLAHYIANCYRSMPVEFEDIRSAAYLGLVKAAGTFDAGKGIKFSTFAVRVIVNEILMQYRKQKRCRFVTISLEAPVLPEEDISLMDMIPDKRNPYEMVETMADIQAGIKSLSERERQVLRIKAADPDTSQTEIGEMMGVSQSAASRYLKRVREKVLAG